MELQEILSSICSLQLFRSGNRAMSCKRLCKVGVLPFTFSKHNQETFDKSSRT